MKNKTTKTEAIKTARQGSNQPGEKNLRKLLAERAGYSTLVATLGTNGNGGMLSDIGWILEADEEDSHLDEFKEVNFEKSELCEHFTHTEGEEQDGDEWVAFEADGEDSQGYLTGETARIYVNLNLAV